MTPYYNKYNVNVKVKQIKYKLILTAIIVFVVGLLLYVFYYIKTNQTNEVLNKHLDIIYEYASDKTKKQFCINKIDSLFSVCQDSSAYYEITMAKAFLYSRQLESNTSIKILKEILQSELAKKDLLLYRNALNLITNEYGYGAYDLSKTIEYSIQSIMTNLQLNDETGELQVKTNLLKTIGAYRKSMVSAKLLIKLLNDKHNTKKEHHIMYLYALVANSYIMINNYKAALETNKLLIRYLDEHKKDKYALIKYGETWLQMSNIYLKLNKPDSAGIYYKKGNEILNKQFKNTKSTAIYSMRYNYLMHTKDYNAALRETILLEKYIKKGNNNNTKVLYESFTKIYGCKRDYQRASKYLELWKKISKQLYIEDYKSKSIANYFLKEQQNMSTKNSKCERKLFLTRIYTYIIIIFVSSVLILFALMTINHIKERKIQTKLEKMQDKIELANNKLKYLEKLYNTIEQQVQDGIEQNLFDKLEKLINEKYIFLDKDINSTKISHLLNSNRTYINDAVKKYTNMHFNQYINHKRILFAKQMIDKYPNTKFEDIAKKVGFKTLDTFRRQFIKYTGTQPSNYL